MESLVMPKEEEKQVPSVQQQLREIISSEGKSEISEQDIIEKVLEFTNTSNDEIVPHINWSNTIDQETPYDLFDNTRGIK